MTGIARRIALVREDIAAHCRSCGRSPSEITLIGVSKFHPASAVREAVSAGLSDIGESYVQEWRKKADELADAPVRWHFIGHLQTNKVKYLVGRTALIHSVDSVRLIDEIARVAESRQIRQPILLELNLSGDTGKTGAREPDLPALMEAAQSRKAAVDLRGLMCMGPLGGSPGEARAVFRRLKELSGKFNIPAGDGPPVLSMGMSDDYQVAIAEGATHIRIGTAIFGSRPDREPA